MECEIIPRHRKLQRKKYHVDLSQDPEIKETTEVYQAKKKRLPTLEKVNEEDMFRILDRYAKDKKLDLYTIAECFDISASALNTALKSDKYKDFYHNAKLKRGEKMVQEGLEVASTPFDKIQRGEEVTMVEVAASKLKSNYMFEYGRALNSQFSPQKNGSGEGGGVNVVVNTGIKLDF